MNFRNLFKLGKAEKISNDEKAIQHSIELKKLSRIPLSDRNLDWDRSFMEHAGEAHLACKIPQIEHDKDGFPYFQLEIPDVEKPFQAYTISSLIGRNILKDGIGVSISSYDDSPDRTFSYGEILNYHYRKSFRSNKKNWIPPSPTQFDGEMEILGGNPSEIILHPFSRKVILAYLVKNNVHFPKVSLLNVMTDNGIMNQLVFNLVPSQFENEKHFQACLSSLAWFLPMHYSYTSIPEHYLGELFFDL